MINYLIYKINQYTGTQTVSKRYFHYSKYNSYTLAFVYVLSWRTVFNGVNSAAACLLRVDFWWTRNKNTSFWPIKLRQNLERNLMFYQLRGADWAGRTTSSQPQLHLFTATPTYFLSFMTSTKACKEITTLLLVLVTKYTVWKQGERSITENKYHCFQYLRMFLTKNNLLPSLPLLTDWTHQQIFLDATTL